MVKRHTFGDVTGSQELECSGLLFSKKPNPPTLVSDLIDHTSMTWKTESEKLFQSYGQ